MIGLTATTKKIQVVLAGAVTTNQLDCFATWRDFITSPAAYVVGSNEVATNNTTDVDLVGAPSASHYIVIDYISIYNRDTVAATVTVKIDVSGTEKILWKGSLAVGYKVEFVEGTGWRVLNDSGVLVGEAGTPGSDGSDGALTVSQAEIDFGATPVDRAAFTVTDAAINSAHKIIVTLDAVATSDADEDENEADSIILSATAGTGEFRVYARAYPGPVHGKRKINYQYS